MYAGLRFEKGVLAALFSGFEPDGADFSGVEAAGRGAYMVEERLEAVKEILGQMEQLRRFTN